MEQCIYDGWVTYNNQLWFLFYRFHPKGKNMFQNADTDWKFQPHGYLPMLPFEMEQATRMPSILFDSSLQASQCLLEIAVLV